MVVYGGDLGDVIKPVAEVAQPVVSGVADAAIGITGAAAGLIDDVMAAAMG